MHYYILLRQYNVLKSVVHITNTVMLFYIAFSASAHPHHTDSDAEYKKNIESTAWWSSVELNVRCLHFSLYIHSKANICFMRRPSSHTHKHYIKSEWCNFVACTVQHCQMHCSSHSFKCKSCDTFIANLEQIYKNRRYNIHTKVVNKRQTSPSPRIDKGIKWQYGHGPSMLL